MLEIKSQIPNPKVQIPIPHRSSVRLCRWQATCFYMKHPNSALHAKSTKPYDIRERTMLFACDVIDVAQELQRRGRIVSELSIQLVNAAMNAASNVEEADDGSSSRDFRAKDRIALRELKESSAIASAQAHRFLEGEGRRVDSGNRYA